MARDQRLLARERQCVLRKGARRVTVDVAAELVKQDDFRQSPRCVHAPVWQPSLDEAVSSSAPKYVCMHVSSSESLLKCCWGVSSVNQKYRMTCGVMRPSFQWNTQFFQLCTRRHMFDEHGDALTA